MSTVYSYDRSHPLAGSRAEAPTRGDFIRRTYLHLAMSVMIFAGLEAILVQKFGEIMFKYMMGYQYSWAAVLVAYMVISWIAEQWAQNSTSQTGQYMGLLLYVGVEAVIFVPLMYMAVTTAPMAIPAAAIFSIIIFAALTLVVVVTGKDFSFLRGLLVMASFTALAFIAASIVFGFHLGAVFAAVMVGLSLMIILFSTSRVMNHYGEDQHVAAALSLFAALALLFWYVLRIAIAIFAAAEE